MELQRLGKLTGISSLVVLMLGPGASKDDSSLQAADGEKRGISNCFLGKVGRSFNDMSSIMFRP